MGFQEEVNHTNKTIELANRLVKGLEVGVHELFSVLYFMSLMLNL